MKLTYQDMLTEVVKRGSKYGWENTKVFDINDISDETKDNFESKHSYDDMARIAVAVLIADPALMKAVYGEVCYKQQSNHPIDGCCFFFICAKEPAEQQNKKSCHVPASLYRALEAFKLLHDPEGNAIKYLYDNLPEETPCE